MPQTLFPALLKKLAQGQELSAQEMTDILPVTLKPDGHETALAALLMGLQARGVTAGELAAATEFFKTRCVPFPCKGPVFDCCGTGGDNSHTVNISTATAFVVAAAGVPVVKHGNRASTSRSGSADVLEAAGMALDWSAADWSHTLAKTNFCFLFAPNFHPALKPMGPLRRQLGFPTLFNLLGPLLNPARPAFQLLGVGSPRLLEPVARALATGGIKRAFVVHSDDGWDEISPFAPTRGFDVSGGTVTPLVIQPDALGIGPVRAADLRGGSPADNARALKETLGGAKGGYYETVALNAAASLVIAGKAVDMQDGYKTACDLLDSKAPLMVFNNVIQALYQGSRA